MSTVDRILRDMVRDEVERLIVPLTSAVERLQSQNTVLSRLASALGQPIIKRGPGRPPKLLGSRRGRPVGRKNQGTRLCAVEDCRRPARSKGYCAAHYQKYRMLAKTGRLPSGWVDDASPGSVKNVVLPRGRAGAKALAEARKKSRD